MDAGLAAVIAGAAGAGGAALAAFGTSLGLLRQAKIQGDHAHQQWLRSQQQQAYEELLAAADRAETASKSAVKAVELLRAFPDQEGTAGPAIDEVMSQTMAVQSAVYRVVLLSEPVGECASRLHATLLDLASATSTACSEILRSPGSPPHLDHLLEARVATARARNAFLEQARLMLQGA